MSLTIRLATAADLLPCVELLEKAGLPVADLATDRLALVAESDRVFQGAIGLETFGGVGLLRSLVVAQNARGKGIGPALVTALEVACLSDGVGELWLLTIDADAFFTKLGYDTRDRSDAPNSIQTTEEFSGLCPGDAVLMSKRLGVNQR